jgi:hypothetical protein
MKFRLIFSALLLVIASAAYAASCPVDGNSGIFTGSTQTVDGVLMKQYRCPRGHTWWSR